MYTNGMDGKKWEIFCASVDLFATKGFFAVSMRDIAKNVGLKAASLYNHFSCKEEILETIYEFYDFYYSYFMPPIETLLESVGKEPPLQTLSKALFRFDPSIQSKMDKIFLIASMQMYCDLRAQDLIFKNIFKLSEHRISLMLNKMIDMNLIEPLDVDSFILTLNSLCHSAALRMSTSYPIDWEVWVKSVEMLFSHIKEVSKK